MLGLIIGIMSVVLVMSVGAGAQSLITNQLKQRGTDLIAVLAGASDPKGPPAQVLGIVNTTLTYEDGQALLNKNNVRHVTQFAAYISGSGTLSWKNNERVVTFRGSSYGYEDIENVIMAGGRFFTAEEDESMARSMVLGSEIAQDIFGNQNPVGQSVKLNNKLFKVVGFMEPKGSSMIDSPDTTIVIPLKTAQRDLLGVHHVSFLRLRVDDEKNIVQTVDEITQTLRERHGDDDFSVRTLQEALQILTTVTNVIKFFLVAVAGISLFVGGVGIMNIMLIAVREKTREIGLRKAVGARNGDIMRQFLVETMAISFVAGVIGIALGVVISYLIALIVQRLGYDYSFVVTPFSLFVACFVSLFIGFIFGLAPARIASKLNPMEALRYE